MKTINLEIYKFEELSNVIKDNVIENFIKSFCEDDVIFKYLFNKIEYLLKTCDFYITCNSCDFDQYPEYFLQSITINAKLFKACYDKYLNNEKTAVRNLFKCQVSFYLKNNYLSYNIGNRQQWNKKYPRIYNHIKKLAEDILKEIKVPEIMNNVLRLFRNFHNFAFNSYTIKDFLIKNEKEYFLKDGTIIDYSSMIDSYSLFLFNEFEK